MNIYCRHDMYMCVVEGGHLLNFLVADGHPFTPIHICICICMCVYIYIYINMNRERKRSK